ncbi:Hpt domain-containing protein [Photobacterium nomapromontoriensis]|uniref:Hpt domain-containing protein n=1 Tax=Photobacterium nomapromontoriensis TaxID=2910237 RepID=UPI003D10F98F
MINFDAFSDAMGGDSDMMSMIIELYHEEHANDLNKIQEQYTSNDLDGLFITVHSLKGVLLTLCEDTASEQFEVIERMCKQGTKPEAQIINEVLNEMVKVNQQIAALPLKIESQ